MNGHFRTECRSCGRTVDQCRCPSVNKVVSYVDKCDVCIKRGKMHGVELSPEEAARVRRELGLLGEGEE